MRKLIAVVIVVLFIGVAMAGCTSTSKPKKNNPPKAIFTVSDPNPTHKELLTFDASKSYDLDKADNTTLQYEWDFNDNTKVPKSLTKTVEHAFEIDGTFMVKLFVYDKKTFSFMTMNLTVKNKPPKIDSFYPPDKPTVVEMVNLDFGVNASDAPNNDNLQYQWSVDNQEQSGETTKTFHYTPSYDDAEDNDGVHNVSVKVNDGKGGIIFKIWSVNVTNKNQPPIISSASPNMGDVNMEETGTQAFTVTASDPDGDLLKYSWYLNTNVVTGQTGATFNYNPGYNDSGTYVLKVSVTDGKGGTAEHAWNVTVTNKNRPPIITVASPTSIQVNMLEMDKKTFSITALDPDSDPLTYAWTLDDVTQPGATTKSYNYTPTLSDAGGHTIIVEVTDGKGGSDSTQWTVTVGNLNQAPQITDYTPKTNPTIPENGIQNFTITAVDPDADPITYQWYLNGTAQAGKTTAAYAFTPDWSMGNPSQKVHTVKVIVADNHNGSANRTWTVTVTNVDRAPIAKGVVNMSKPGIGLDVKFDASTSSDPDGDVLTFTWAFGDSTPNVAGKIVNHNYAKPGLFTATVTVSDGTLNAQAQVPVDVNITQSWQSNPLGWTGPVVIDDVDGDGTKEIITADTESDTANLYTGYLYIFDGATHNQEFKSADIGRVLDIKIGDVDKDGSKEVVVGTIKSQASQGTGQKFNGYVYVFAGNGQHTTKFTSANIGEVLCIGLGDVDGDTAMEIVAPHGDSFFPSGTSVDYYGNISVFSWSGAAFTQEWISANFNGFGRAIDIADIDADGTVEAVIGTLDTYDLTTNAFHGRALVLGYTASYTVQNTDSNLGMVLDIVVADPDKDLSKEAVVGEVNSVPPASGHNIGHIHVLSSIMGDEWTSSELGAVTCVAVADPDLDNINELIFGVDYNETEDAVNSNILYPEGYFYILNGQSHAQKFKSLNIGAVQALALGNLDKSANLEMAVGTWTKKDANDNYEGYIYVFCYNTDLTTFQQLWKSPKVGMVNMNSLVMDDVNNDGSCDIVFGTEDAGGSNPLSGKLYVFTNKNAL